MSGTLYPTADMWVIIHTLDNGKPAGAYGPFDNWADAKNYQGKMPSKNTKIMSLNGIG